MFYIMVLLFDIFYKGVILKYIILKVKKNWLLLIFRLIFWFKRLLRYIILIVLSDLVDKMIYVL